MNDYKVQKIAFENIVLEIKISNDNQYYLSRKDIACLFNTSIQAISKRINSLVEKGCFISLYKNNFSIDLYKNDRKKPSYIYCLDLIKSMARKEEIDKINKLELYLQEKYTQLEDSNDNIIIYNNGSINIAVNVSIKEETVWLNESQIAELFETTRQNINHHIKSIFLDDELNIDSVCKYFLQTAEDGKRYSTIFYNLDMILAIGYRVKSIRAVSFRKWASSILKEYMLKGYSLNDERLINLSDSFNMLKGDVYNLKIRMDNLEEKTFIKPVKERIFFKGEFFDAYEYICSLIESASREIIIIDPYFDLLGLKFVEKAKQGVLKHIITSNRSHLSELDVDKFESQFGCINLQILDKFHDRFLIIDKTVCYSLGASLNTKLDRAFAIIKLEDNFIIKKILDEL